MAGAFYSYILAQVLGLTLIIMSVIMGCKVQYYRDIVLRLDPYNPALVFSAAFGLLLGSFLIVVHNLWVWEPRLIITLISWFVLVKSILWLSFPVKMLEISKKIYLGYGYYILAVISFLFGVFLLTKGFYLFIPEGHFDYNFF